MKLSKDQIKYIDDYLKDNGIKYWDIRLELIDHLASKLEKQDHADLSKTLLIKEFGTTVSLSNIFEEKRKSINKKYRKLFFQGFVDFFKSSKNVLIFSLLFFIYYQIFKIFNTSLFLKITLLLVVIPVIITGVFSIKDGLNKNKSIHLDYTRTFSIFAFLIFNSFYTNIKPEGLFNVTAQTQGIIFLIITPIYLVLSFSGFKIYYKTHKEYTRIYNELQTI